MNPNLLKTAVAVTVLGVWAHACVVQTDEREEGEGLVATSAAALPAGASASFEQILSHNQPWNKSTNVCQMIVTNVDPAIGAELFVSDIVDEESGTNVDAWLSWSGSDISDWTVGKPRDRIEVSGCNQGGDCELTVRLTTKGNSPTAFLGCSIIIQQPTIEHVGLSLGSQLQATSNQTSLVKAQGRQKMLLDETETTVSHTCTARVYAVSDPDGIEALFAGRQAGIPIPVVEHHESDSVPPFPTNLPLSVLPGTARWGIDATSTRAKYMLPFDTGLPAGTSLWCEALASLHQSTGRVDSAWLNHDTTPPDPSNSGMSFWTREPQGVCEPFMPPAEYWNEQVQPLVNQLQVCQTWGIEPGNGTTTKGDPSVYVCVIDTGFHLDHAEFEQDAFGATRSLLLYQDPDDPPQNPRGMYSGAAAYANDRDHPPSVTPADAHGTALLSIAAGRRDDTGICGVAGRCSILALRTDDVMSGDSVGRCLEAALDAGGAHLPLGTKRVIVLPRNSDIWKGSAILADALAAAASRDDVLIVGPTGNADPSCVEYPTTQDVVMGVGAVNASDGRALEPGVVMSQYQDNPDSLIDADPDNDGPGLSVMAPGLWLTAADLTGDVGFGPLDYVPLGFSGTAAAAAHVAGVAALLFSHYPSLTAAEVRDIIERTADKVGTEPGEPDPYEYDDLTDPSKPRNPKMGYGRVNAFRAMQLARVVVAGG